MQSAVIAAFYHCCSSTKKPTHGQCPTETDSWGKFQKATALGKIFTAKASGLPQNILNIVKPHYFKLCDQKLLEMCLHGLTQNANESFNGVLWNIVPKQNFVELQSLKLGASIAVLHFNEGASGLLKVINKLGFNAGSYMIRVLKLYDHRRINDAERHSLPFTKLKRKKHELSERKKGLHQEEKEGVTYDPGKFYCDVRVPFNDEQSSSEENRSEESELFKNRFSEGAFQILERRHLHCNDERNSDNTFA
ncbi:uncharacterized protein TNCV_2254091 [Trichonephila clavipes]|nr:uncharacterized protein TNCV_2254091 [Trichonephila clavipes]